VGEEADVGGGDGATVLVAEEIFEENSEAVGQAREVDSWVGRGEGLEAEEADSDGAGGEGGGGAEAVGMLRESCHRFLQLSIAITDSKTSTGRKLRAGACLEAARDANRRTRRAYQIMWCAGAGRLAATLQRDAGRTTSDRGRGDRDGSASS
jgi:hypothetical protein